jgi:hypothetical protein
VSEDLTAALARLDSFDDVGVVAERWLDAGPWEPQPNRKDELTVGLLLLAHLSRDALRLHARLWCWTEMMPAPRARRRSRWGRRLSNRVLRGYVSDRGTTNAASDHPHNRKKPADPGARHGTPSS